MLRAEVESAHARISTVSRRARLYSVLAANVALVAGLAATGALSGSLGVLAEALDCLADALGVALAVVADRLAGSPASRAPALAAAFNSTLLLVSSLAVALGAVYHLVSGPPPVPGTAMLLAGAVTAAVMGGSAALLANGPLDLGARTVLVDTAGDALAAAGVAAGGAVVLLTGGTYWVDPAVGLAVSGAVACQAWLLLRTARRNMNRAAGVADNYPLTEGPNIRGVT